MFLFHVQLFGQDFQWVRQIKGAASDYEELANGMAVDADENSYIIGNTESNLFDIDPTASGVQIIDNSSIQNFRGTYLIKVDQEGNFMWGKTFGDFKRGDNAIDVKIGADGFIYALLTIGAFNASLNSISSDIKIVKFSPSGTLISTTSIKQNYGTGNNNLYVYSFDLDAQNNIYLSGWFSGNLSINDNPNVTLNATNGIGNYLLKINSNGNFDWVKQFNIPQNSENKVIVRPDGNLNLLIPYLSNYVLYNIDRTTNAILWQKDFINQWQNNFYVSNNSIILLGDKNLFSTIDVDPSGTTVAVSGNTSFIIFLNLDGSFLDVKQFTKPNNTNDVVFRVATTDVLGNYFFAGNFNNTIDFDASNATFNLSSSGGTNNEGFYLKLDANRNFENAFKIGYQNPIVNPTQGCYEFKIKKISVQNNNNYLAGEFQSFCDFDPSPTTTFGLQSLNGVVINRDGFVLKLGPCTSAIPVGSINQTFCSAENPTVANLIPNSSSIKWYNSSTSINQLNSTFSLVNGQTYYAARQIGSCPESQRLAVTVTINPSPTPPVAVNQSFCESENALLSNLLVSGQDLKWYTLPTGLNPLSANTVLQNNTTYFVTQTVNSCESTRTGINVVINSIPAPTSNSLQTFCIQDNPTLASLIISGQNIKWYATLNGGSALLNTTNLVNGQTYFASQTINTCESLRTPVSVIIQNTTTPTGTANQTFCLIQNPTVSALIIIGTNLKWYDSISGTTSLSSTTVLVNGATYYVSQTIGLCESVNRLSITVNLINTLNANDFSQTICDELNDGVESINLANFQTNLIANNSNFTFEYFFSLLGAVNQNNTELISPSNAYNLIEGNNSIFVRIASSNGCHQIVNLNLTLVKKPILTIPDIVPICENRTIIIDAGAGFDNYIWSNGATSETISVAQAGNYSVTVSKNYGTTICSTTKNFEVVLSNRATITKIDIEDWTDSENSIVVNISSNSIGNYEYSIDGIHYQNSAVFSNLKSGEYTVYVRDINKCGIAKKDIYLLMYPKYFTPNGDGYNDTWAIQFSVKETQLKVIILDRYGKLLKKLENNASWDGKLNGNDLPSTDYWFVVTRENGKEYRGHFTL